MALSWTYLQIRTKINQDLDLENEDFVQPTEMLGYVNEGIDVCEALIHTIYEDYFLTSSTISLVLGTSEYALPTEIYANKIRGIIYTQGSQIFRLRHLKTYKKFEELAIQGVVPASFPDYSYFITNSSTTGIRLRLVPAAQETAANVLTMWYLRNARRLALDADLCDIPEFVHFVIQYAKMRCYEKEGHPNLEKSIGDLGTMKTVMEETLTDMVPDEDNAIIPDASFYDEFNDGGLR